MQKHVLLLAAAVLTVVPACADRGTAEEFGGPNRILRNGAIRYGDANYDAETSIVRRVDGDHNELDVCQHSLEYAAALLSANQQIERANSVVSAVLDHQDVDEKSRTFGNFRWWHSDTQVRDRNAVAFMTPWLCHIALEYDSKLTPENAERMSEALARCVVGVRAHGSGPDYSNIWLLKAASMVMVGRTLARPELCADGAERLDQWIEYTAQNGISEYNSPCYNAVDVYALEWIYHYATDEQLRQKAAQCLDYLYADIFQNWHWQAGIGAGTHSRAYEKDRDTGRSLVSCLVYKQCGQPMKETARSFVYVFAVNDYPVPAAIRALARKDGMYPFSIRYRVLQTPDEVECTLFMTPDFSLGTQTGRRPVYNDRPLWDIPLKITYAGTTTERRASYIAPRPTTKHATIASLQSGPKAIVIYEVDMKDSKLSDGRMRLDVGPAEGGMCDEIVVAGRPYDGGTISLKPGTVLGWRVAKTLVALRLLRSQGIGEPAAEQRGEVAYRLAPVEDAGLCLDCPLTQNSGEHVAADNLNCGFVLACATTDEHASLAEFLETFHGWEPDDRCEEGKRRVEWRPAGTQLQLVWDESSNRVISKAIDGQPVDTDLRYDSPLIRLADGDLPDVVPEAHEGPDVAKP